MDIAFVEILMILLCTLGMLFTAVCSFFLKVTPAKVEEGASEMILCSLLQQYFG